MPQIRVYIDSSDGEKDFLLTPEAFQGLAKAPHAGMAEWVFHNYARHVPPYYRLAVWDAVDQLAVKEEYRAEEEKNVSKHVNVPGTSLDYELKTEKLEEIAEQNRAVRARYGEDGTPLF